MLKAAIGNAERNASATTMLWVAAVATALALSLLACMVGYVPILTAGQLTGAFWYVLLLLLGAGVALAVFSVSRSYATYSGTVLDGKLELGGPLVAMMLVVAVGLRFAPNPASPLDVTLRAEIEGRDHWDPALRNDVLAVDFDADSRSDELGPNGQVRFSGIPSALLGRSVRLTLRSERIKLKNRDLTLLPGLNAYRVAVSVKPRLLSGSVLDDRGRPVAAAVVHVGGQVVKSDSFGDFELEVVPRSFSEDETISVSAPGYEVWRSTAVLGSNAIRAQLSPRGSAR